MDWACSTHGREEKRIEFFFVGEPQGKRPLRKPRRRWDDNIGMDLRGMGWEGLDWMHLAEDRDQWWSL